MYNPDRNPNLLDMPSSESDQGASRLLWEEDLRDDKLENEYFTALQAHLDALDATLDATVSPAEKTQKRKEYMCSRCAGVPKKGHICPKASPSKMQEAERLFVGSGGCEANAQISYWAVLPVSQRTPRTHT